MIREVLRRPSEPAAVIGRVGTRQRNAWTSESRISAYGVVPSNNSRRLKRGLLKRKALPAVEC